MDYAFLMSCSDNMKDAGAVQKALLAITTKVKAVTMATHTVPWTVFAHCSEELSEDERSLIQSTLNTG